PRQNGGRVEWGRRCGRWQHGDHHGPCGRAGDSRRSSVRWPVSQCGQRRGDSGAWGSASGSGAAGFGYPGGGGAGGNSSATVPTAGGAGGIPGGGGGGGAATNTGVASGAGGAGARGEIWVISYGESGGLAPAPIVVGRGAPY